jgi:hypothetical protein
MPIHRPEGKKKEKKTDFECHIHFPGTQSPFFRLGKLGVCQEKKWSCKLGKNRFEKTEFVRSTVFRLSPQIIERRHFKICHFYKYFLFIPLSFISEHLMSNYNTPLLQRVAEGNLPVDPASTRADDSGSVGDERITRMRAESYDMDEAVARLADNGSILRLKKTK